ncbi:MAG: glucose 1-dehydrogenase [Methylovirgula sp.]|uniref:SDR family NAD(P)-dependent oxidoreductase n=1 Tax=Methylovirgula sp. TaxID=1978224 RepID=UPI0030765925
MDNPVVLITGALTGIGRATALAFASEGAHVVVSGRRDEAGTELAAELHRLSGDSLYIHADVSSEANVERLINEAHTRFGRIDVAVNNAGVEGRLGPLIDQTVDSYSSTFGTNVLGTILSLKHELLVMRAQGHGNIINISSTLGHKAAPGTSIYAASKHAIEGLTKVAALEAATFGVRVNAIAPGPVETEMLHRFAVTRERRDAMLAGVPLKRAGMAEEIAQAILFIASDKAAFVTGHIFAVDGGRSAT